MARRPRLKLIQQASALRVGDMVVCPDGSVGLLSEIRLRGLSSVQFGASGPFHWFPWKILRKASKDEIEDAGLAGVGCNA